MGLSKDVVNIQKKIEFRADLLCGNKNNLELYFLVKELNFLISGP